MLTNRMLLESASIVFVVKLPEGWLLASPHLCVYMRIYAPKIYPQKGGQRVFINHKLKLESKKGAKTMYFSDEMHKVLDAIAKLWIPFAIAIIFGFSQYIEIPHSEAIIGCLGVVDAALGTLLEKSTRNYRKAMDEDKEK